MPWGVCGTLVQNWLSYSLLPASAHPHSFGQPATPRNTLPEIPSKRDPHWPGNHIANFLLILHYDCSYLIHSPEAACLHIPLYCCLSINWGLNSGTDPESCWPFHPCLPKYILWLTEAYFQELLLPQQLQQPGDLTSSGNRSILVLSQSHFQAFLQPFSVALCHHWHAGPHPAEEPTGMTHS